jgi:hypothetical protein
MAVRVSRSADDVLLLEFALDAELARLRIPPSRPTAVGHELWRHTCFEAFVARDGAPGYREMNFSPSGEWAAFDFRAYREVDPLAPATAAPRVNVRRFAQRLELDAEVALGSLTGPLRLALATVIEDEHGALSYWALHHPPGRPDFHHHDAFVVQVG